MVSIIDVARAAGVSNKTVSRVVNGEPYVTTEMRERVEQAIRELGYVPNMAARMVRSSRSQTFGIVTDYVSTTPYSGDIVRGIQDWATANGKIILLANTGGDSRRELSVWNTFRSHQIEGVLYVTMYHRVADPEMGDVDLPTVLLNCHPDARSDLPSIEPDDTQGSRDLTRYLLERGHRRIGYIRLNPILLGGEQRYSAFRQVAAEAGVTNSDIIVRLGMDGPIGRETNYVYAAAREILSEKNRPTAIMCGNDEMAIQVYLAALHLGLRIPEDISVAGFDDFRTLSLALKPELTTAALPYYDLGFKGAEHLNRIVESKIPAPTHVVVPCQLIERRSVIGR